MPTAPRRASSHLGFARLAIPIAIPAAILGGLHGLLPVQLWRLSWLIISDLGIGAREAQRAFTVWLLRNRPLIVLGNFAASGHVCPYTYVCVCVIYLHIRPEVAKQM